MFLKAIILTITTLSAISPAFGQTTESTTACPNISVSCEANCLEPPFLFKAAITGAEANQPIFYHWIVSGGQIVDGQGTSVIKVVDNKVRRVVRDPRSPIIYTVDNRAITAFVELKGVPAHCKHARASMSILGESVPLASPVDEFGAIGFKEAQPRLDKLIRWLKEYPGATASIISSGKWSSAKRAMDYLIRKKGLEPGRVVYVQKEGKGPLSVILYLVPAGAIPPK